MNGMTDRALTVKDVAIAPLITARVAEFCSLSGISKRQVYRMIKTGELKSVKFGTLRLINVEAYRQFLVDQISRDRSKDTSDSAVKSGPSITRTRSPVEFDAFRRGRESAGGPRSGGTKGTRA